MQILLQALFAETGGKKPEKQGADPDPMMGLFADIFYSASEPERSGDETILTDDLLVKLEAEPEGTERIRDPERNPKVEVLLPKLGQRNEPTLPQTRSTMIDITPDAVPEEAIAAPSAEPATIVERPTKIDANPKLIERPVPVNKTGLGGASLPVESIETTPTSTGENSRDADISAEKATRVREAPRDTPRLMQVENFAELPASTRRHFPAVGEQEPAKIAADTQLTKLPAIESDGLQKRDPLLPAHVTLEPTAGERRLSETPFNTKLGKNSDIVQFETRASADHRTVSAEAPLKEEAQTLSKPVSQNVHSALASPAHNSTLNVKETAKEPIVNIEPANAMLPRESDESRPLTPAIARAEAAVARPVVNQVVQMVMRANLDGMIEVRLQPEELGRVRLTLTQIDTGMSVHITAERPETLDLLRRNIDLLANDLRNQGFENASFTFGQNGTQTPDGPNKEIEPDASGPDQPTLQVEVINKPTLGHDGKLDIRL